MKRIFLIIIVVVSVLLAAMGGTYYLNSTAQDKIAFSDSTITSATYFFCNGVVEVAPDVNFHIDTGSPTSLISPEDIARLRNLGLSVDSIHFPVIGADTRDNVIFSTKMYLVSFPVSRVHYRCDSLAESVWVEPDTSIRATIDNIAFMPGRSGEISVIGTDVLSRFVTEQIPVVSSITFRFDVPDGYERFCKMEPHLSSMDIFGAGPRYYIEATVSGVQRQFFVNTGIDGVKIKMPRELYSESGATAVSEDLVKVNGGLFKARTGDVLMQIGNRIGSSRVHFSNTRDNGEPYYINLFNFLSGESVFDFRSGRVYLRPHSYTSRQLGQK